MKERPEISDDEINDFMDFDSVLLKHKKVMASKIIIRLIIASSVIITALSVWYLYEHNKIQPAIDQPSVQKSNPVLEKNVEAQGQKEEEEPISLKTNEDSLQKANPVNKGVSKNEKQQQKIVSENALSNPSANDAGSIERQVDYIQAEPVDGYPLLYEFLNSHLQYPVEAIKDSIQGVQVVSFIVNRDGKPEKIEIINSLGKPFEQEAMRLINSMPPWKPATLNGKPVPSKISLPLTFKIY